MSREELVADAIIIDFVEPILLKLEAELARAIRLHVCLKFSGVFVNRLVLGNCSSITPPLDGDLRIVVSDSAIANRFKCALECIFRNDAQLSGFSGFKTRGAVRIEDGVAKNDSPAFAYCYNHWDWGKKFRDFG